MTARPEHAVPFEQAIARLVVTPDYDPGGGGGPGPCVHTLRQSSFALIGAHWRLDDVRALLERYGAEEAGEQASARGHALCVCDDRGWLFLAARPAAEQEGGDADDC